MPINDTPENCGLRKIGLRRSATDPGVWDIFVSVRNYGAKPRTVNLALQFGGAPAGSRALDARRRERSRKRCSNTAHAPPACSKRACFRATRFRPTTAPWSSCPNRRRSPLSSIRTSRSCCGRFWRRIRMCTPYSAVLRSTRPSRMPAWSFWTVFVRPLRPRWIPSGSSRPPADRRFPFANAVTQVKLTRWHSEHPLGEGLRSKDLNLESATVFEAAPDDIKIARSGSRSGDRGAAREAEDRGDRISSRALGHALRTVDAAAVRQHSALDGAGYFSPAGS